MIFPKLTDNQRDLALEVYRQKYEIFRHFDNLRWQIPTITLGAGSLLFAFTTGKNLLPLWWSLIIFGLLSLFSGFAVFRVRKGILKNYAALAPVAEYIGDKTIPAESKYGATWWLIVLLVVFGVISIGVGIFSRIMNDQGH